MKTTSCTEKKRYAFDNAPRCSAKTKRNKGAPCRSPAVKGKKRCRMHGGLKEVAHDQVTLMHLNMEIPPTAQKRLKKGFGKL